MPTSLPFPTDASVHRLQAVHGPALVSVLLRTEPGPTLSPADQLELAALIDRAVERVHLELGEAEAHQVTTELRRLAAHAAPRPTSRGLALFVGDGVAEGYRLPITVESRTVVDPTFATRDLVRTLAELPPYRVLVLGADEARLLIGTGDTLTDTTCEAMPERDDDMDGADRRGHLLDAGHADRRTARRERFLRAVDAALRTDDVTGHLPLFVIAAEPTLGAFTRIARTPIAGTVRGNHLRSARGELRRLVLPVVRRYVHSSAGRDLDRLHEAAGASACHGVDAVWSSAMAGRVHLLLVEQAFTYPARLAEDGTRIERAVDAEAPGVLDDLIDELIELVRRSDGHVRFVPSDTLTSGVAALLRGA
jgi:hypothetical protein